MAMSFKDALKRVGKEERVKTLAKEGFFLNSGLSILPPESKDIMDWTLTYYNADANVVVLAAVVDDGVEFKDAATPLRPTHLALDTKVVKTNDAKMLEKAKTVFAEFKQPLSQVIASIHCDERGPLWTFAFVTKSLFVVTIKISASTGEVLSKEMGSLTK